MNEHDMLLHSKIKESLKFVRSTKSFSQLQSKWQKHLTLNEMKQIVRRANAPSFWQSIFKKSEMINSMKEKVKEHSDFIRTIRYYNFEQYVSAGESELQEYVPMKRRKHRSVDGREKDYSKNLISGVRPAMEAAVHIIPSGSGTHLGNGLVLTCAHCVAHDDYIDKDDEYDGEKIGRAVELINARGETFGSICIDFCNRSDLAMLKILHEDFQTISLGSLSLADQDSDYDGLDVFALGNPCDIDLENIQRRKRKNGYNPFYVSQGKLVMKISEAEANKNRLGRLIHSCWTYWGHSGCPLVSVEENDEGKRRAQVVGLHNSWNDRNGNRHGIPLEEIRKFSQKSIKC